MSEEVVSYKGYDTPITEPIKLPSMKEKSYRAFNGSMVRAIRNFCFADTYNLSQYINQNSQYKMVSNAKQKAFTIKNAEGELTLTVSNIDTLKPLDYKIFQYALSVMNQQITFNDAGVPSRLDFYSSLNDLVDIGLVKNEKSAWTCLDNAFKNLQTIAIKGHVKIHKGNTHTSISIGTFHPFDYFRIEKSIWRVYLQNPRLNELDMDKLGAWRAMLTYPTAMPLFFFKIDGYAYRVGNVIFSYVKQNAVTYKIKDKINIPFSYIYNEAFFPALKYSQHLKREIYEQMKCALQVLNKSASEYFPTQIPFKITPHFHKQTSENRFNIDEFFLGYITVEYYGTFREEIIKTADKEEKCIEASRKKKEKREEKAKTNNLAKHMEKKSKKNEKSE